MGTSDSAVLEAHQVYSSLQEKLAITQHANEKGRVTAIYATIANRRRNF